MADFYKHFFISGNVQSQKYKTSPTGGQKPVFPPRDREAHSAKLLSQFEEIWIEKERLQQSRTAQQITTREGTYISFTSAANHDLITKSLENLRKGIRLLNVKEIQIDEHHAQVRAIVYVPNGKEGHFINKIKKYQEGETRKGLLKNAPLVNSIEDVSIALLEGLWTDNPMLMPGDNAKWCEAWLNVEVGKFVNNQIAAFSNTLSNIGIDYKPNSIVLS